MFDLTDYSGFLDMERELELEAAIAVERAMAARDLDDRMLASIELDMEVQIMMEMV